MYRVVLFGLAFTATTVAACARPTWRPDTGAAARPGAASDVHPTAAARVHEALRLARTRGVAWPRIETVTLLAGAAGELGAVAEKTPARGSIPILCDLTVPGRVLLDPVFRVHEGGYVSAGALACLFGEGTEVASVPFFSKRHTEVELASSPPPAARCIGATLRGREENEGLALHATSTFRVRWWQADGAPWPRSVRRAGELIDELSVLHEEVRRDPRPEVLELRAARQTEAALRDDEPARGARLALARVDLQRAARLVPLAMLEQLTGDAARSRAAVERATSADDADDAEVWYLRGQLLERSGRAGLDGDLHDLWRAADAYRRAIGLDHARGSGHAFYRLALGRVLVEAHRHRAALRELVELTAWLEEAGLAARYPEVIERAAQLAGTALTYRDFDGPPASDPARTVDVLDEQPDPRVQERVLSSSVERARDVTVLPDGLLAPRALYWAAHELATLQLTAAAETAAQILQERWPAHPDARAVQALAVAALEARTASLRVGTAEHAAVRARAAAARAKLAAPRR